MIESMSHEARCSSCGGRVTPRSGTGRFRSFRWGISLPIPDDVEIPTCERCGELYVSAEQAPELERRMQAVFKTWAADHVAKIIKVLALRHSVNQRQIARICDITPSHLSHILGAQKPPSITLIRLLEAFVACASEFERQRQGKAFQLGSAFPHAVRTVQREGFLVGTATGSYEHLDSAPVSATSEAAA